MKKKGVIFTVLILTVIIILCLAKYYRDNQSIKSFMAIGCSVQELSISDEGSFLKIILDDDRNTVKTIALKDGDVIEMIGASDIKDIIGVNIVSDIPKKILEEKHINIGTNYNPLQLLTESDGYDTYFEIEDVSFSEQHSFVGKVMEETTTYMIVEPADDEYERTVAEQIRIEYGTDHKDYLYGIGRLVVIYYKGKINTDDGKMSSIKTDDISVEGFRDWEMKVTPTEINTHKTLAVPKRDESDSETNWFREYNLYYYNIGDVIVIVDGKEYPLAHALKLGKITMSAILAKANGDVADGVIQDLRYDDGGSVVFKYPDYTIVKYHTLDGNDDMYIGTPDIDIHVKDK